MYHDKSYHLCIIIIMEMQNEIIRWWESHSPDLMSLVSNVIIAVLIVIGGKILISASRRLVHHKTIIKHSTDETLGIVLSVVIRYGIMIICLIMILDVFGINTTGLLAILGAAGVAVGFALKDTLGNIASGVIILFLRPFKIGDFIEFGSVSGTVREKGLFAVLLDTPDGLCITAPNSSLWGIPIKNYSQNPSRRMDIAISISYQESIDEAFQVMMGIIEQEQRFLKDPPAQVMVQSLGESGVSLTLRAWVSSSDFWKVYWDQMKNIKERIQEAGLNIALPRRDIRLVKDEEISGL